MCEKSLQEGKQEDILIEAKNKFSFLKNEIPDITTEEVTPIKESRLEAMERGKATQVNKERTWKAQHSHTKQKRANL